MRKEAPIEAERVNKCCQTCKDALRKGIEAIACSDPGMSEFKCNPRNIVCHNWKEDPDINRELEEWQETAIHALEKDIPEACRECKHRYFGIVWDEDVSFYTFYGRPLTPKERIWKVKMAFLKGEAYVTTMCSSDDGELADYLDCVDDCITEGKTPGKPFIVLPHWLKNYMNSKGEWAKLGPNGMKRTFKEGER